MKTAKMKPLKNLQDVVLTLGFNSKSEEFFFHSGSFSGNGNIREEVDFFSIVLCTGNSMALKVNHVDHVLQACSLMITKPKTIIELPSKDETFQGVVLFFSTDFIIKNVVNSDLFKPFRELEAYHFLTTELMPGEMEGLLDIYKILDKKKNASGTAIELEVIKSIYFIMVCEVAEIFLNKKPEATGDRTRVAEITAAFQHIVKHTDQKRQPLKHYADQIFITEKYLIKAVQTTLDRTPKSIIDEAVTIQAKRLLENAKVTISQVAETLRFADVSSFSRFFKAQTGEAPSEYRQKL